MFLLTSDKVESISWTSPSPPPPPPSPPPPPPRPPLSPSKSPLPSSDWNAGQCSKSEQNSVNLLSLNFGRNINSPVKAIGTPKHYDFFSKKIKRSTLNMIIVDATAPPWPSLCWRTSLETASPPCSTLWLASSPTRRHSPLHRPGQLFKMITFVYDTILYDTHLVTNQVSPMHRH